MTHDSLFCAVNYLYDLDKVFISVLQFHKMSEDHRVARCYASNLVRTFHFSVEGIRIICLGFHCKKAETKIQISYF